jgi:hypothetical protein
MKEREETTVNEGESERTTVNEGHGEKTTVNQESWLYHSELPQVEDVTTLQLFNVGFEKLEVILWFDPRRNHHDWEYVAKKVAHCSGHIAYHRHKVGTECQGVEMIRICT